MTTAQQAPDILSPEFAADPYAAYRVMREGFPLIWHEPMRSYIISRYEDVERAFKEPVFTRTTTTGSWSRSMAAPSCR